MLIENFRLTAVLAIATASSVTRRNQRSREGDDRASNRPRLSRNSSREIGDV